MLRNGVIRGLGVDMVDVMRFQRIFSRDPKYVDRFTKRILNSHELHKLQLLESDKERIRFVAGSWAAKEAVFKTLDPVDQKNFVFNQWYRFNDGNGKPHIASSQYSHKDQFLLSISHDKDLLIATVLRQEIIC